MKIAMICSDRGPCPPVKGGAIQLYIAKVAPILAKKHKVTVFSISDTSLPNRENRGGVTYVRYPKSKFEQKVLKKIKKDHYDIAQVFNRPTLVTQVKKASPKTKVVLSLHNLFFGTKRLKDKDARACLKHVDYIVTVSRFVARHVTRYGFSSSKIRPVYSGVDLKDYPKRGSARWKKWRKSVRKRWRIPKKSKVVLFVGRLVPDKGSHVVLKSMKSVIKKHRNVRLLVVGSKWYAQHERTPYIRKLYREAAKLNPHVTFTSYIPVNKMPRYYAAADVFVCASQWKEPLARVHYEAMAASLPIVTTRRGGNAEVMIEGKNGYSLRAYRSSKAFSTALNKLLRNRQRAKKMGRYGRKLTERKYTFTRVARDLQGIYRKLDKNK
ncbi:hypothetical protein BEP19_09405 [Ammoniphilus oxalaticus]|uniref:Glycosyl transferase family 1 n=1 Tax=Ammoniphilus oxalaticus TaxID=66863 RepID=A0A419SKP6_9BACL|nr:glycosyltransferase family 4 protein [Ammoniphilus oxalaticus]RKD24583.1 hypothetical protein BEP19_09405 [Ammoniphilus oxalaticus]